LTGEEQKRLELGHVEVLSKSIKDLKQPMARVIIETIIHDSKKHAAIAQALIDVETGMAPMKMDIDMGTKVFIPEVINIEMAATREPEKQISMKEEMISLDDLDTGQYKAMVIQDPSDKQSVKGFIYIAYTTEDSENENGYEL